jgi:hypothetical protein
LLQVAPLQLQLLFPITPSVIIRDGYQQPSDDNVGFFRFQSRVQGMALEKRECVPQALSYYCFWIFSDSADAGTLPTRVNMRQRAYFMVSPPSPFLSA